MGVIDLDARVKKLEQEGTGGAVIDQLESAVTAIENELTVTVTDITDDITTDPEIISEGVTCDLATLETYGKIVHFHAEFTSTAANVGINGPIYTIPETLAPRYSGSDVSGLNTYLYSIEGGTLDGSVMCTMQFTEAGSAAMDQYWIANPAPTPGE